MGLATDPAATRLRGGGGGQKYVDTPLILGGGGLKTPIYKSDLVWRREAKLMRFYFFQETALAVAQQKVGRLMAKTCQNLQPGTFLGKESRSLTMYQRTMIV